MTFETALIRIFTASVLLTVGGPVTGLLRTVFDLNHNRDRWWKDNYLIFAFLWGVFFVFALPFSSAEILSFLFGLFILSGFIIFIGMPLFLKSRAAFVPDSEVQHSRRLTAEQYREILRLPDDEAIALYVKLTGCQPITARRQVFDIKR